jgi:hypothetical protein
MRNRELLIVAAILAGFGIVSAQQRPPAPTFRSTTQYVAVDVIVTDLQDRVVEGLTKDDFSVMERGVVQAIDDFSFVAVPLAQHVPSA